jgi:hypothetical protein
VLIGALAALASFALFHLVTVFPLSWMTMFGEDSVTSILWTQVLGGLLAGLGIWCRASWPTALAAATPWAPWRC